jgi:hypothetical protein
VFSGSVSYVSASLAEFSEVGSRSLFGNILRSMLMYLLVRSISSFPLIQVKVFSFKGYLFEYQDVRQTLLCSSSVF